MVLPSEIVKVSVAGAAMTGSRSGLDAKLSHRQPRVLRKSLRALIATLKVSANKIQFVFLFISSHSLALVRIHGDEYCLHSRHASRCGCSDLWHSSLGDAHLTSQNRSNLPKCQHAKSWFVAGQTCKKKYSASGPSYSGISSYFAASSGDSLWDRVHCRRSRLSDLLRCDSSVVQHPHLYFHAKFWVDIWMQVHPESTESTDVYFCHLQCHQQYTPPPWPRRRNISRAPKVWPEVERCFATPWHFDITFLASNLLAWFDGPCLGESQQGQAARLKQGVARCKLYHAKQMWCKRMLNLKKQDLQYMVRVQLCVVNSEPPSVSSRSFL